MSKSKQTIDQGRVRCPVRGEDVDIELCVACPRLAGVELDSDPHIVCQYDASPLDWATAVAGSRWVGRRPP